VVEEKLFTAEFTAERLVRVERGGVGIGRGMVWVVVGVLVAGHYMHC
jgi:hypothetical protein